MELSEDISSTSAIWSIEKIGNLSCLTKKKMCQNIYVSIIYQDIFKYFDKRRDSTIREIIQVEWKPPT